MTLQARRRTSRSISAVTSIDQQNVHIMRYDPGQPHHLRYVPGNPPPSPEAQRADRAATA